MKLVFAKPAMVMLATLAIASPFVLIGCGGTTPEEAAPPVEETSPEPEASPS